MNPRRVSSKGFHLCSLNIILAIEHVLSVPRIFKAPKLKIASWGTLTVPVDDMTISVPTQRLKMSYHGKSE